MRTISASRREDMPAFRMNELLEKYRSMGDDTFWVLWTKNPKRIIDSGMDFRRVALQLTVTGMGGTEWEPHVPTSMQVWDDVATLVKKGFNPDLINWRFDPIIHANAEYVKRGAILDEMAKAASSLGITRCITSFVTFYGVVKQRWPDWEKSQFAPEQQTEIVKEMKDILGQYKVELYGCVQPHLAGLIRPSACIDGEYYGSITGFDLVGDKDKYQRKHCNCTASYDIGKYRKCSHGCLYCYSKTNQDQDNTLEELDIDDF